MSDSTGYRSGKGHRDENFPVASRLIRRRHRDAILAFYEFVRTADDIADHASLDAGEKLDRLDRLEASLLGNGGEEVAGQTLHAVLQRRGLTARHAQDLLHAFRQDVTKHRYATWDELIDYCSYSAMPVGRFVLDVHGEARTTWPASDALCAALQIINHLQDCAQDYRDLDRVYIPLDALGAHNLSVAALGEARAEPTLLNCLHGLTERTAQLLQQSRDLPMLVRDARLAAEISAIQTLARRLLVLLRKRDPLSQRVHLGKAAAAAFGASGAVLGLLRRLRRSSAPAHRYQVP